MKELGTVHIVDDDVFIRKRLEILAQSIGLGAVVYNSGLEFLESWTSDFCGCIISDVRMPGITGFALQEKLNELGATLPLILISAHSDVSLAVAAIHKGAFDFLEKPLRDHEILDRIQTAVALDKQNRIELRAHQAVISKLEKLTRREAEVMNLMVEGHSSRSIALRLGIARNTVEIHRHRVMEKMEAENVVYLVRMVLSLPKNLKTRHSPVV